MSTQEEINNYVLEWGVRIAKDQGEFMRTLIASVRKGEISFSMGHHALEISGLATREHHEELRAADKFRQDAHRQTRSGDLGFDAFRRRGGEFGQ